MESNELKIFIAVAQEGSITKAAKRLGYVQSNVTARIQQLESDLNTQLFYRQHGMLLTPMGTRLLSYAEEILHLLDKAEKALNDSGNPSGDLYIGTNNTISTLNLPLLLSNYNSIYPDVNLSLTTSNAEELIHKIVHFELDVAFVKSSSINNPNIIKELVFDENLVLISSNKYNDIQSLCSKPFLMNSIGCPNRLNLELWLKSEGISNIRFMDFNSLDLIIEGVISGLGASFVPESSVQKQKEHGLLNTFEIPERYSHAQTFVIRHKDSLMTSSLLKFIEMITTNTPYHKLNLSE
jgi:DNA-binding transcriptional LysR family regulator